MAKKFNIKKWQENVKRLDEGLVSLEPVKHYDSPEGEGIMAKGNAFEASKDAQDICNMISPHTNLPEWVEAKITLAANYLNKVKDYLSNYDVSRRMHEQSFEDRLKAAGGFSDEEFDDITSTDPNPFMDDDDPRSPGEELADRTIADFRRKYRGMSDNDLDDFSVAIMKHLLNNVEAKEYAKKQLLK